MAYDPHTINRLRFWIATGEITSLETLTWGCYALREILGLSGDVLQEFSEWMGDGEAFQKKHPLQVAWWLYEHQIPFILHFILARDLKPLAQIRAFWHILRANREFKAYPQIRLGAIRYHLKRNLQKRELDLLETQMEQRPIDPLETFRLLVDLQIPFVPKYRPCFGIERDRLKEDMEYNWNCFRFIRVAKNLQNNIHKNKDKGFQKELSHREVK